MRRVVLVQRHGGRYGDSDTGTDTLSIKLWSSKSLGIFSCHDYYYSLRERHA